MARWHKKDISDLERINVAMDNLWSSNEDKSLWSINCFIYSDAMVAHRRLQMFADCSGEGAVGTGGCGEYEASEPNEENSDSDSEADNEWESESEVEVEPDKSTHPIA